MRVLQDKIVGSVAPGLSMMTQFGSSFVDNITGGIRAGVEAARGTGQPSELFGSGGMFTTVVNALLFLIGSIAVIMIIIGGLRYVLSGGDAANVTTAKNTILYAIVGIVVALLAYAAVRFVVESFTPGGTAGL